MTGQTVTQRRGGPLAPLRALFDPFGAVPVAVREGRFLVVVVLATVLSALASATVATRLDASWVVLPKLEAAGELSKASEREVSEQVAQAQRVAIVTGVAGGLFGVPLLVLAGAIGVSLVGFLVGGKGRFIESVSVAALAMLPLAVAQGIRLVSALRQEALSPSMAAALVPSSLVSLVGETTVRGWAPAGLKPDAFVSLVGLVDVFHLWSGLLIGLGVAATTRVGVRGGLVGVTAWFLALAAVTVGVPGLLEAR